MEDLLDEEGVDLDAMLGIEPDEPEPKPPPGVRVDPRRHKVVCKHWLRGLCKKGDDCDFLHQLDRDRMPECWFFSNFGECSNKDCIFLHIRPEDKVSTGLRQVPLSSSRVDRTGPSSAARVAPCTRSTSGPCPGAISLSHACRTSPHPTLGPPYPSPHGALGARVPMVCARLLQARPALPEPAHAQEALPPLPRRILPRRARVPVRSPEAPPRADTPPLAVPLLGRAPTGHCPY